MRVGRAAAACTIGLTVLLAVPGAATAQDRPAVPVEVQCRREVDRLYAPGSLSRARNERQRLIDACVANGGSVPQAPGG